MKKLLDLINLWKMLPEEWRTQIMERWPWLIALALALALTGYFCACKCCGAEPKRCPYGCSARCECGCNQGEPCRCASRGPDGVWRPYQPAKPVIVGPVVGPVVDNSRSKDFGVERDKIGPDTKITRQGKVISRDDAVKLLKGGSPSSSLSDDSRKARLTVIGAEADRKKVLADIESDPALKAVVAERCLVTAYPPDHWAVAGMGFVTTGTPTIYLQAPTGKVLHRQDDYEGGAARLVEAIRKADATYQPKKDPDLTKPWYKSLGLDRIPPAAWLAGGFGVVLLLNRKQQQQQQQ